VKTEPERAYTLPKVVYPGLVTDMIGVKERKMAMSNEKDSVAAWIGHGAIGIDHRSISSSMWTHATGDLAALDRSGRTPGSKSGAYRPGFFEDEHELVLVRRRNPRGRRPRRQRQEAGQTTQAVLSDMSGSRSVWRPKRRYSPLIQESDVYYQPKE